MDKLVVIFSMKSCPFCHMMKEMLDKENIEYFDRDIDDHKEEYDIFPIQHNTTQTYKKQ